MTYTPESIPVRSDQVVFRKIDNEYILVPLLSKSADVESIYNHNEVGAVIWERIDGKKSARQIIDGLVSEYDVEPDEAEGDVLAFIRELSDSQLIRIS